MTRIINESLDYLDFENQIEPRISIDEYAATMGKDSEIVTVGFTVNSEEVGNDLVDWLERGYTFVLDAQVSEGELPNGKYLVFVELSRRTKTPERIIEMLDDLKTLTGLEVKDWTVQIDDEDYDASEDILKQKITLSPKDYRDIEEQDEELNEMRTIANLPVTKNQSKIDSELRDFKTIAGL
jgi:hypothetical protein